MNNYLNDKNSEINENIVAGIVGAFLFSLAGAAVYFGLHLIGYIASVSGLIGAVCAFKGYTIFSKKETKKGLIISAVISLLVIVIAWFFCLSYDIYDFYKISFEAGELVFSVSFADSIRLAPVFLKDPEVSKAYFGDLALGLFFCLLGSGSFVITKLRNANKKNAEKLQEQPVDPFGEQPESEFEEKSNVD